jgi:hypothetical protein
MPYAEAHGDIRETKDLTVPLAVAPGQNTVKLEPHPRTDAAQLAPLEGRKCESQAESNWRDGATGWRQGVAASVNND